MNILPNIQILIAGCAIAICPMNAVAQNGQNGQGQAPNPSQTQGQLKSQGQNQFGYRSIQPITPQTNLDNFRTAVRSENERAKSLDTALLLATERYKSGAVTVTEVNDAKLMSDLAHSNLEQSERTLASLERSAKFSQPVNVQMKDSSIKAAADALTDSSGLKISLDSTVPQDIKLNITANGVALGTALEAIADRAKLMISPEASGVLLRVWPKLVVDGKMIEVIGVNAPWSDEWGPATNLITAVGDGSKWRRIPTVYGGVLVDNSNKLFGSTADALGTYQAPGLAGGLGGGGFGGGGQSGGGFGGGSGNTRAIQGSQGNIAVQSGRANTNVGQNTLDLYESTPAVKSSNVARKNQQSNKQENLNVSSTTTNAGQNYSALKSVPGKAPETERLRSKTDQNAVVENTSKTQPRDYDKLDTSASRDYRGVAALGAMNNGAHNRSASTASSLQYVPNGFPKEFISAGGGTVAQLAEGMIVLAEPSFNKEGQSGTQLTVFKWVKGKLVKVGELFHSTNTVAIPKNPPQGR